MKIDFKEKILLLDFDGTIVATEHLAKEAILTYFQNRSLFLPSEISALFSRMIVGRTWAAAVGAMVEHATQLQIQLDSPDILAAEFKRLYRQRFEQGAPLVPGFLEALPQMRQEAKFIGIVTGSEHEEVRLILESHGLAQSFDRIWAFGDYERSKPDPSPYLTALQELQAQPSEVWVFEDSAAGMESAHRAGLSWVQICYEQHAREPDPRSKAVILDWTEL